MEVERALRDECSNNGMEFWHLSLLLSLFSLFGREAIWKVVGGRLR